MPITLDEPRTPGLPVVKRTAIGQTFNGAVVKVEQRDRVKREDGVTKPLLKPDGQPRKELVVTAVTLPGTTAPAGLGDQTSVPEPGELVRLILKGKAFGDWIEQKNALGRGVNVGDVVSQTTDGAQAYDAHGSPTGPLLTTQAEVDALPRGRSVGIYGPLTLRAPKEGSEWIAKAEAAYYSLQEPIAAEAPAADQYEDEEPF